MKGNLLVKHLRQVLMFGILAVLISPVIAKADIVDNFDSYPTGPLSTVSGGQWNTWMGTSTDATVATGGLSAPNAMKQEGTATPDVVSYSSTNLLGYLGAVARVSFDFRVHEEGSNDPVGTFWLGSGDQSTSSIDYSSGRIALLIDWLYTDVGTTNLTAWDNFAVTTVASGLPVDAWLHVDLIVRQTVVDMTANASGDPDGAYDVYLNSALLASGLSFWLNSPVGLNALEVWFTDDASDDHIMYDNISITAAPIPEPSTVLLLGAGVVGLGVWGRKRVRGSC